MSGHVSRTGSPVSSRPGTGGAPGLTDEFLRSLDEEFDRQRMPFDYEASVASNDSLSQSSASQSHAYGRLPSWYEVEKASMLVKPVIPKWDVIPKLDKLDRL